jgi:hypothetical protein
VGANRAHAISHISNLGTLITFSVRDRVSLPSHPHPNPHPRVRELTVVPALRSINTNGLSQALG